MLEQLILLGFGTAAICGLILCSSLIVWVWDQWDEYKKRKTRREKEVPAARRKAVEDYWKGAA